MPLGGMAAATARRLEDRHGLRLADLRDEDGAGVQRSFDAQTRTVRLSRWLLPGQQAFQMATQIALLEQRELIDRLAARGSFSNDEARSLARIGLANYFADALVLPYAPFLQLAERLRYDIDLLGREFGTGFETICHRLSTLQRPEARGFRFSSFASTAPGTSPSASRRRISTSPAWAAHVPSGTSTMLSPIPAKR